MKHISISTCLLTEKERAVRRAKEVIYAHLSLEEYIPTYIYGTAEQFYEQLYEANMQRHGAHITRRAQIFTSTIAACVYYAFKVHQQPRTPQEICILFHINRQLFSKGCRHCSEINMLPLQKDTAEHLFTRFGNHLKIPYTYMKFAIDTLYTPIKSNPHHRYKPAAVAGGLICALIEITKDDPKCYHLQVYSTRDICDIVGVCSSIIRAIKIVITEYHAETDNRDDGFDAMFVEFFGRPSPTATHQ